MTLTFVVDLDYSTVTRRLQRRRLGPGFGGDGVGALAPKKFFFAVPPNCDIWGGRRGIHCLLELNVSSV